MAVSRTFIGDDPAYVPDLGKWVNPGDVVDFDEDPDSPQFVTRSEAKKHDVEPNEEK